MFTALIPRPLRSMFRGWEGEQTTRLALWMKLDPAVYQRLHDVIIPAENGTTQIDHVLVSPFGVFVIETKNKSGSIYGQEKGAKWTQVLGSSKYSFQNPLHQNYRHTQCLAKFLQLDPKLLHSIVFFIGDATIKTPMPPNVLTRGLSSYIHGFTDRCLDTYEIAAIMGRLTATRANPALTSRLHKHALEVRFSSTTVCPKCSGALVERVAKKGPNAGGRFVGCANYPKCRFTKEAA